MTKKKDKAHLSQFERVKEITDRLESGIQELFESEAFKNYLKTLSKFHDYSLNNTILIAMQKPDATLVAGYTAWQRNFGRQVQKGETGIRILAPSPYKKQMEVDRIDPSTGQLILNPDGSTAKDLEEIMVPAYKVVNVFDVSQTEGKPLPSIGVDELTGDVQQYEIFFDALKKTCPVPVEFEHITTGAKGYYHTVDQRIAIQEGMSQVQTIKTLIHEMAHQKLHSIDPKELPPEEPRLRDHNISSLDQLQKMAGEKTARRDKLLSSIQTSEKRLKEIGELKKHIINYSKTRSVYEDYRRAGYSKKFFEAHREEITLHKAAKQAFDELAVKRIPKVKELSAEYSEVLQEKRAAYAEYKLIRDEAQELVIAKRNIESLYEAEKTEELERRKEEKSH